MKKISLLAGLIAINMLCCCTNQKEKSQDLIEANKLHLESIAMHERVEAELSAWKNKANEHNDLETKLDSLHNLVKLWEEGVVEVPGFEHAHNDGEHHHEHKPAPQMTDESMLEYQRNAKEAIQELYQNIKTLE